MEPYEEFYKKQFARIQGEDMLSDAMSDTQQRVSVIKFHGVAVLSPLLTAEKMQEMQQYRHRAIELNEKKQNCKKTSLLTRVQEILESVQVKKGPSINAHTESEAVDQMPSNKNLNGFTILPNVISLPVLSAQHESMKFEKSLENVLQNCTSESNKVEAIPVKKNSLPIKRLISPAVDQSKDLSSEMSSSPPQSEWDTASSSREAPDPYKMSLQNLLKKSREYIEKEQSRRHLKNPSKGSVSESNSDKENDTIKISNSLKEKAKVLNRSRSCSPLMIDKPMLNKSNTLLQAASSQCQSLHFKSLSTLSNVDLPLISGSSSVVESESDEELKGSSFADCESNILKSLTGSYAKLPSPEPSLSPKMHRRRPRPLSAGNIVITNPVNAYDLSPKENGKAMEFPLPKTAEKTSLSDPVPKHGDYNAALLSIKRHSLNTQNAGFVPNIAGFPVCVATKFDSMSGSANAGTDIQHTVSTRGTQQMKLCSTFEKVPCVLHHDIDLPDTMIQHGIKTNCLTCSPDMIKHSSPVELNKSYDVETPSPILIQSQGSGQATETPLGPCLREPFLENQPDIQIKRRLELDLDTTPPASGEQRGGFISRGTGVGLCR
uniref:LOC100170501 protein n=1 Tax=Xenopus tropicalis TaxID=8364 RepID=B3DLJ4_XENTR|nr:LOC100170501 protein [Xenopus tropicalis]